jgi:Holliday junction resolvasome RuvABC endonuclease subunit
MDMVIAGIDYSICGPAVCLYSDGDASTFFDHKYCSFYFLTENKRQSEISSMNIYGERMSDWNSDEERYETIADWAQDIVMGCSSVALEGYAFGAHGRVFQIAENTGILKYKLYRLGIPVTIVPPTEVKKTFCGRGNGDKNAMYDAFIAETGINLKAILTPNKQDSVSPVSDIVDSYAICKHLYDSLQKTKEL